MGLSLELSSDEEDGVADNDATQAHDAVAPFLGPPPKAFCLELSPFNFLWSLLSAWITRDTIAYLTTSSPPPPGSAAQPSLAVQQQQQQQPPEAGTAPHQEVPPAALPPPSLHTHSIQARAVLAGLLEPHVHGLLHALHMQSCMPEVDKRLSHVLSTLVFPGPIPSLSLPQWNLLTLALLRALSLGRVPRMAEALEDGRVDLNGLLSLGVQTDSGGVQQQHTFSLPHLSSLLDLLLHD